MITIKNDGPDIVETDYWDSDAGTAGYFYVSINAGACRLLVPDSRVEDIADMRTASEVIITRGTAGTNEAYEVMFEDGTDNPYCITIDCRQSDRLLPPQTLDALPVSVWTRTGRQLALPGRYRYTAQLPDMRPWSGQ